MLVSIHTSESSLGNVPVRAAAAPDIIGFGVLMLALKGVVVSATAITSKVVALVKDVGRL